MVQVKLENKKKIGILGGTFDPAHKGHIKISLEAKKRYGINKIIWAITKKNPYKSKSEFSLNERIKFAKQINSKNKFIKVKCYENIIKSNRTIDLLKYIKRKNKNNSTETKWRLASISFRCRSTSIYFRSRKSCCVWSPKFLICTDNYSA